MRKKKYGFNSHPSYNDTHCLHNIKTLFLSHVCLIIIFRLSHNQNVEWENVRLWKSSEDS